MALFFNNACFAHLCAPQRKRSAGEGRAGGVIRAVLDDVSAFTNAGSTAVSQDAGFARDGLIGAEYRHQPPNEPAIKCNIGVAK